MLAVYTIVLFVAGYTVSTPELVGDSLCILIFNALLIIISDYTVAFLAVATIIIGRA